MNHYGPADPYQKPRMALTLAGVEGFSAEAHACYDIFFFRKNASLIYDRVEKEWTLMIADHVYTGTIDFIFKMSGASREWPP